MLDRPIVRAHVADYVVHELGWGLYLSGSGALPDAVIKAIAGGPVLVAFERGSGGEVVDAHHTIPMRTPAGAAVLGTVGNDAMPSAHATHAERLMPGRGGDEGGRYKASKDSDAAAPSASPTNPAQATAA